jgi:general secretion pathway protein K
MDPEHVRPPGGNEGFALPLVIWTLALLAAIVLGMTAESRSGLAVARNLTDAAQAEAAADGGLWRTVGRLLASGDDTGWRTDGTLHPTTVGAVAVDVAAQDESGKIDLNKADPRVIANLLETVGVGGTARETFVTKLVAARSPSEDGAKPHRLTAADVSALIGGDGPLQRLRPFVTIYSGQAGFNPATAPREVLLSAPGVQATDVDAYLRIRGSAPPGLGVLEDFSSLKAAASFFSWFDSQTVTITAKARWQRSAFTRIAVIDLATGTDHPYDVLAWRDMP